MLLQLLVAPVVDMLQEAVVEVAAALAEVWVHLLQVEFLVRPRLPHLSRRLRQILLSGF
jgi:hypothetical protein